MHWIRLTVPTQARVHFVDITRRISEELKKRELQDGVCHVYVPHTTAAVTINENADPDVVADIQKGLERFVPFANDYRHSEGNSAAHIKASLMGFTVTVPVCAGRLALGTWQSVYLCEFDGPRQRSILVGFA